MCLGYIDYNYSPWDFCYTKMFVIVKCIIKLITLFWYQCTKSSYALGICTFCWMFVQHNDISLHTYLERAMADFCCTRSAAAISGALWRGECLICRKQSRATTARCSAKCGLLSGTAAMLAITVAACSCRNTDTFGPLLFTAWSNFPAVPSSSNGHTVRGSMNVKLARAAAERSNVSQDVVVAARPGNIYLCNENADHNIPGVNLKYVIHKHIFKGWSMISVGICFLGKKCVCTLTI